MRKSMLLSVFMLAYFASQTWIFGQVMNSHALTQLISDEIVEFDSVSSEIKSPTFAQLFGTIEYPVLGHITEEGDTLLIYKLINDGRFFRIFVMDIKKAKAYFISHDSKMNQKNIKDTPLHPYFMDFFSVLEKNRKLRNKNKKYWWLTRNRKRFRVVCDKENRIPNILKRKFTRPDIVRENIYFGGTNDGDFNSYLANVWEKSISNYLKKMMGDKVSFTLVDTLTKKQHSNLKFIEVDSVSEIPILVDSIMKNIKINVTVDTIR